MVKAYVLVQIAPGADPISSALALIPGVALAEDVRGPYDAIALAHSESARPLERVVAEIRNLPGVIRAIVAPLVRSLAEASGGEAA